MGKTIAIGLLLWALPWMGAAMVGLWRAKSEFWRAFWLMSGVWAFIDAGIALFGLLGGEPTADGLRRVLWINAGLDVAYVLVGLFLLARKGALNKGLGWAIVVQGVFLLGFDVLHALRV